MERNQDELIKKYFVTANAAETAEITNDKTQITNKFQ